MYFNKEDLIFHTIQNKLEHEKNKLHPSSFNRQDKFENFLCYFSSF